MFPFKDTARPTGTGWNIICCIRTLLWRVLGLPYGHVLRNHDFVYLQDDPYATIGTRTYENGAKVWRWGTGKIEIGKFCSIANGVNLIVDNGSHFDSQISSFPLNETYCGIATKKRSCMESAAIKIGNDTWIGMGTYILPGVTIGNGVTIGANSVVVNNVPDYCVVVGAPAKIVKIKHAAPTIKELQRIQWWNWPEGVIRQRLDDFDLPVIDFVDKYGSSGELGMK